jgi:glutamine---fructose-6-phosphate transaminase (isomerizing)
MQAVHADATNVVAHQHAANAAPLTALAARLRDLEPSIIFTCARGSSDHAATFAKYLFETHLGIPTLSQAPSINSIYGGALLHIEGQPFILVSQSGRSPYLLASAEAATKAGALVIAQEAALFVTSAQISSSW